MLFRHILKAVVTLSTAVIAADTKYFHEPGNTDLSGHYDIRFFKEIVNYDARLDTLTHLTRAWLDMTAHENIETWLAHGTLLGWWWNAKLLPWDWDVDVQVHTTTLQHLGKKYNLTHHQYHSLDRTVNREYLLDVNAYAWERTRGDGNNIIDARWIDVRNGLFIDITGIAETDEKERGVLRCKNNHRYEYEEIYPLRDTLFEGYPAKIPYAFDDILATEYGSKALVATEYEGHRWNGKTKTWELADDVPATFEPTKVEVEGKAQYRMVETGGFWYNVFRLVHWW